MLMNRRFLPCLLLLGGCYGYYPPSSPAPVGREVELTLSDSGSFVLAQRVGPSAAAIEGRYAADSANSILLSVTGVRQRNGDGVDWRGERVLVPRPLVIKLEERRFSRGRTALFAGAVAVGLLTARQALGGLGGSSGGSGLPGKGGAK
jgi:hypothetical protein